MDVINAMVADSNVPLSEMRVDGGTSMSGPLLQAQADFLGVSSNHECVGPFVDFLF